MQLTRCKLFYLWLLSLRQNALARAPCCILLIQLIYYLSLSLSQRSQIFCLFNTELEDKFKYSFTFGEFLKAFANFRNFKDLEYFQHTLGKSFCYWLILIVVIDQVLNKYSCHLVTLVKSVQVSRQSDVTLVSFY